MTLSEIGSPTTSGAPYCLKTDKTRASGLLATSATAGKRQSQKGSAMWIVIGIVGALIIMAGALIYLGESRSEIEGERYTAKKPLEIKWENLDTQKELRLRIPADYISRIYTRDKNTSDTLPYIRHNGVDNIHLEFYLPDLKPRVGGAGNLRGGRADSPGYPKFLEEMSRQIIVNLTAESGISPDWPEPDSPEEKHRRAQYENILRETKQKHGIYRLPDVHGSEHYRYKACGTPEEKAKLLKAPLVDDTAPEGCWDRNNNEIFVSQTDTNGGYYLCARQNNRPNPNLGCHSYGVSFDGWHMQYSFRKSRLANWKEIDSAVRKVLESFRQDAVNQDSKPQ